MFVEMLHNFFESASMFIEEIYDINKHNKIYPYKNASISLNHLQESNAQQ